MISYNYIHLLVILHFNTILSVKNRYLHAKTSLDFVTPGAIGLQFSALVNNTSEEDYFVEIIPDQCCLKSEGTTNCDIMNIIGSCCDNVEKGSSKTLKMIAPLLDPFDRHGYCIVYLNSRPQNRKRNIMRNEISIDFDTRHTNREKTMDGSSNIKHCTNTDEDPFNDCNPVNCETYYNGYKSFFNKNTKRCVEVPKCIQDSNINKLDVVYDPNSNRCVDGDPISEEDIEFIKSLNKKERPTKDIMIIRNFKASATFNDSGDEYHIKPDVLIDKKKTILKNNCIVSQTMRKYLTSNKYKLSVLGLVITVQCCLICTMMYCLTKGCTCCQKKKVVHTFFNYRQDASVTTPLICTSNIDTETTDYQFLNESSNVDKKIKCYKACQRDRRNNARLSMSDDILSKCLNRRDWNRLPRTDTIPEIVKEDENESKPKFAEIKTSEAKVSFENELPKVRDDYKTDSYNNKEEDKYDRFTTKDYDNSNIRTEDKYERYAPQEYDGLHCEMSEKEIKCHTYNYFESKPNFMVSKHYDIVKNNKGKKGTISLSSEKGAQAYFSNDSIDDFLSERGIFLADNHSKFSFTSSSTPEKSCISSVSSKTSKNNILKNVLSLLSRKSKPSSVPGAKKSKAHLDLQLLHMSRASIYSSTNNVSDRIAKRPKDSRSSL